MKRKNYINFHENTKTNTLLTDMVKNRRKIETKKKNEINFICK